MTASSDTETWHVLLVIEDVFNLSTGHTVVVPDFPYHGASYTRAAGRIVTGDGTIRRCTIGFSPTHFNIPGCTDVNRRWRWIVEPLLIAGQTVSVGDRLDISDADLATLLGLERADLINHPAAEAGSNRASD